MAAKPMTAADYAKHAESVKARKPTQIITLKSGSVFELRRPDLRTWVMQGRVPQSLLEDALEYWGKTGVAPKPDPKEELSLSDQTVINIGVFCLHVVQDTMVSPRLVEFPDPKKNEIGPLSMLDEDFQEVFEWAIRGQGVAGVAGLRTFPNRRQRRAAAKSNGKKLRPETVGVTQGR